MGYSYRVSAAGRKVTCCDACPAGAGRKRPCPAGWCPSCYYCAACWKGGKRAELAAYHARCTRQSACLSAALAAGVDQAVAYSLAAKVA